MRHQLCVWGRSSRVCHTLYISVTNHVYEPVCHAIIRSPLTLKCHTHDSNTWFVTHIHSVRHTRDQRPYTHSWRRIDIVYDILEHIHGSWLVDIVCETHGKIRQHMATHCSTLQYTASHCNTQQYTALHCNTLQQTAMHYTTLQHTATHRNTLQHTATHCNTMQHTATYCNTLQHTATHCNTL